MLKLERLLISNAVFCIQKLILDDVRLNARRKQILQIQFLKLSLYLTTSRASKKFVQNPFENHEK